MRVLWPALALVDIHVYLHVRSYARKNVHWHAKMRVLKPYTWISTAVHIKWCKNTYEHIHAHDIYIQSSMRRLNMLDTNSLDICAYLRIGIVCETMYGYNWCHAHNWWCSHLQQILARSWPHDCVNHHQHHKKHVGETVHWDVLANIKTP